MLEVIPLQKIQPVNTQKEIRIPGSKSYTNRALLLAALAKGKSTIHNPLVSDDTQVMISALKRLGIKIIKKSGNYAVYGMGGIFKKPSSPLYLGNAGTAVRFLTAILATTGFNSTVTGNNRMLQRPINDLISALTELGTDIEAKNGCPPVKIKGSLKGGTANIKGNISSQYLSALLMALPYAVKPATIRVSGHLTSLPYISMTLDTMRRFGVKIRHDKYRTFFMEPAKYKPLNYQVEGDASSASYFFAIAALNKCKIKVLNISKSSAQADLGFIDILKKMGCAVKTGKNFIAVTGPEILKPLGSVDVNRMPDSAMTAAIVAAFANGKSVLRGLANLRVKESDRLSALKNELEKIGVKVKDGTDYLEIYGNPDAGQSAVIKTYNDHRMAMCFAVAGSRIPGIIIKNPQCVSKTYPDFWKDLALIGVKTAPPSGTKNNIVLGGLRGTGKTVIGRELAALLHFKFVDSDEIIEKRTRKKIAAIVKEHGWAYFRNLESSVTKELGASARLVIATGGGILADIKNARHLKRNGTIVLLKCKPETSARRIKGDTNRPALTSQKNLTAEIKQLWRERKENYFRVADLVIDTSDESANIREDANKKAKKIINLINAGRK